MVAAMESKLPLSLLNLARTLSISTPIEDIIDWIPSSLSLSKQNKNGGLIFSQIFEIYFNFSDFVKHNSKIWTTVKNMYSNTFWQCKYSEKTYTKLATFFYYNLRSDFLISNVPQIWKLKHPSLTNT